MVVALNGTVAVDAVVPVRDYRGAVGLEREHLMDSGVSIVTVVDRRTFERRASADTPGN